MLTLACGGLVDARGYVSQEAVNLLQLGVAVTNVFDGVRRFGDDGAGPLSSSPSSGGAAAAADAKAAATSPTAAAGGGDMMTLRGAPWRGAIGLLSLHEVRLQMNDAK